jgi:pyruvate dehydrogenase (quinone)
MLMGEIIAHKLPIKVVIIKNNTLAQIKWEQMVFQGNPECQATCCPWTLWQLRRLWALLGSSSTIQNGRAEV